jgi:hypothetical protein
MRLSIVMRTSLLIPLAGAMGGCGAAPETTEDISAESSALISTSNTILDGSGAPATQCTVGGTTMHCCPAGRAMVGARVDQNVFKCGLLTVTNGTRFLDTGTQRNGMHACPVGSVMVGLHEGLNRLACQTLPGFVVREGVDTGTQDGYPMHVCGLPGAEPGTMSGIRIDQNRFTCATDARVTPPSSSTVSASITVDVGAVPPAQGCGSTTFLLDGAPMTFLGSQLLLDSIYHCRYSAVKPGVPLGNHTVTVLDFNACRTFSASAATTTVTVFPFQCF